MDWRYCIICGQRPCSESNIDFFKVPKGENQRVTWIESCGKYLANGAFVCLKHFPRGDIGRKKLRNGALPSLRYIRNVDGGFGFNNEVFSLMKEKCNHLQKWQKHGCILIDESKITETNFFYKNTMAMVGFVDLGDYTSEEMQNQLGNHGLVFMFQPFAGHGLQALACFLSRGNISGELQTKLILECILLCENARLYIDVVTSDGATWNRKMWNHLGINNSLQPWCDHPVDSSRKLRMCSDFPHLIKCLRNNLAKKRTFPV